MKLYPLTIIVNNPTRYDIISIKYLDNDKGQKNSDYVTPITQSAYFIQFAYSLISIKSTTRQIYYGAVS